MASMNAYFSTNMIFDSSYRCDGGLFLGRLRVLIRMSRGLLNTSENGAVVWLLRGFELTARCVPRACQSIMPGHANTFGKESRLQLILCLLMVFTMCRLNST